MTTPPPSDPVSDAPAPPPPSDPTAAATGDAQAANTAQSQQSTAVRDLAATLDAPPIVYSLDIKGTVTATSMASSPPTISVQLSGDTNTTIAGVRFIDSYSPVVGDTCLISKQGSDMYAIGQMNDAGSGSANGWQTPSLGSNVTTDGNTNGAVQYRLLVDSGDNKVQLKGSVAITSGATALWTMPTGYRPSSGKRTVIVARDSGGGNNTCQVDFNTSGAVTVFGGTTGTHSHSISAGSHSHSISLSSVGSHQHNVASDHTHSHGGAVASTSFNSTLSDFNSFSISGNTGTGGDASGNTGTQSTVAPVWISFNNVAYFI